MNKLPLLSITLLMSISGFSIAADAPTATLYSLTRVFEERKEPAQKTEGMFAFFKEQPALQITWKLNAPQKQNIISIKPGDISITDASGATMEWSTGNNIFSNKEDKLVSIDIDTQPKGDWIEIKGNLSASVAKGSSKQPAQTVKSGEKGKLNIKGLDISYEWEEDENIQFSMSDKDNTKVADIRFRTKSGQKVKVNGTTRWSGMKEMTLGYSLDTDEKEVSVIVSTYKNPTTITIPLNMKVGFSGVQK